MKSLMDYLSLLMCVIWDCRRLYLQILNIERVKSLSLTSHTEYMGEEGYTFSITPRSFQGQVSNLVRQGFTLIPEPSWEVVLGKKGMLPL